MDEIMKFSRSEIRTLSRTQAFASGISSNCISRAEKQTAEICLQTQGLATVMAALHRALLCQHVPTCKHVVRTCGGSEEYDFSIWLLMARSPTRKHSYKPLSM